MSAREDLDLAARAIGVAVTLLREHVELMERFAKEERQMESVGPVLAPTLFRDTERRAVAAIISPLFVAARTLVSTYDEQISRSKEALAKVASR